MNANDAARVLGLRGGERPEEIEAIYSAQAASLDARIASAGGEQKERYVRDREEVELARLALLGSQARVSGSEKSGDGDSIVWSLLLTLLALGAAMGLACWFTWKDPIRGFSPLESAAYVAGFMTAFLIGGVIAGALGGLFGGLFKRDWAGAFTGVYAAGAMLTFFLSGEGSPIRAAFAATLGSCCLVALVFGLLAGLVDFVRKLLGYPSLF